MEVLTMDDTSILSEWIAYHYFALNMRYLIVLSDINAYVSPHPIIERWRKYLTIEEWTDRDITTNFTALKRAHGDSSHKQTLKHRRRQNFFYKECLRHLQYLGKKWVAVWDTDEYLVMNEKFVPANDTRRRQPGHAVKYLEELEGENKTMFAHQLPCISVPRALYSAVESSTEEIQKDVPAFLNASSLNTLRFRHLSPLYGSVREERSKTIVDVTQVQEEDYYNISRPVIGMHRPIHRICNPERSEGTYESMPLHLHHYVGTKEAYLFKDDPRRDLEDFLERSEGSYGANDVIRPWIGGFVDMVGQQQALYLLQDAGVLPTRSVK